jgi:hypothetical protein
MEATSDELFFPTRGTDWYDGGVWQADYLHTWTPTHRDVVATWNALSSAISVCNTTLFNLGEETANDKPELITFRAQATFLRSFYEYYMYDLWRVYPSRDPFNQDFLIPPVINTGDEGFYKIVSHVKAILPYMKDRNYNSARPDDAYKVALYGEPDVYAGYMLLAKLYLNKEVYTGVSGYDSCEMYLDKIIDEGGFGLANNYFAMFYPNNDTRYKTADDEAILVAVLDDQQNYGIDDQTVWVQPTFHYNQTLGNRYSNWNGCAAPEGYLQSTWIQGTDTATDFRWKDSVYYDLFAVTLGFNYGQQYDVNGNILNDRLGNLLSFTFACDLLNAAEYEGVRAIKYAPSAVVTNPSRITNDFLIWRYADALLMKAECLVRADNNVGDAMALVNEIRTKRNAPEINASDVTTALEKIYIERGLELYWEGHRRQDMIRFGTFLDPKTSKPDASPSTAILLPVPQAAIDGTPGGALHQNPGY